MDINSYTSGLTLRDGIYFSKNTKEISYPEKGNEDFFQIEDQSYWFKHRNDCIAATVKKFAPEKLFFDIGGGNGFVSRGIAQEGIDTVLVEPGITGCLNAKKYGLKNIVCSTLEETGFHHGTLPGIGLFDVVEHIEKDVEFLKMIHDYLLPDGLVFITVPAYQKLWSNEDEDAGHFRRYTMPGIKKKLVDLGFKVEYSSYLFSFLPLPILLFRTIPSKLGFNKDSDKVENHAAQHGAYSGFFTKILNAVLKRESSRVKMGKKMSFGSSCFIIARKSKL